MNIDGRKIWQIAAGDKDRRYPDPLLKWDVVAMGPGCLGGWPEVSSSTELSAKYVGILRQFNEDVVEGNLVVLRLGTDEVYGVGEIVGGPAWLDDFGDIDGWDLQFVRRVRWLWKYDGKTPKRFKPYTLKLGATVQDVNPTLDNAKPLLDWLQQLEFTSEELTRELVTLPPSCRDKLAIEPCHTQKVGEYLFDRGIAAQSIDAVLREMAELVRIAKWYQSEMVYPSDAETVAYLAVPLLRVLGWTPQKMAIEWNNVDVALFHALPRKDPNVEVVVEVKIRDSSSLKARDQAENYTLVPDREKCSRVIVTDGIIYAVYVKSDGKFGTMPSAYLNLTRMMDDYPILGCKGAKEALEMMAPDWNPSAAASSPQRTDPEEL
ncbi:MAG: hypothetical protein ABSA96_13280 [Candidatus Acidiferrales bacterium]